MVREVDFQSQVLGSNLNLPDVRSNVETSRRISFYRVYLVSLLTYHNIFLYMFKQFKV